MPSAVWAVTWQDDTQSSIKTAVVTTATELNEALTAVNHEGANANTTWVIKLNSDITLANTLEIRKDVTLDLNGHVLSLASKATGSVIKATGECVLTVADSDSGATHKFNKSSIPWVLADDNATGENIVEVKGGIITGGNSSDYGGGICVDTASLTMTGGSIVGCRAYNTDEDENYKCGGGGLGIYNKVGEDGLGKYTVNIELKNIDIIGCSTYRGGGLYVRGGKSSNAEINMSMENVNISSCNATYHSCAEIGISCTRLNIQSGTFCGNVIIDISGQRGGVYGGTFTGGSVISYEGISGGTFNSAVENSGTISGGIFDGKVTNLRVISGGTFNGEVENKSTGPYWIGTIYTGKITLGSAATITTADGCNEVKYCVDGSEYARQAVKSGDKTSALTINPEKTGNTFEGWYKDGKAFDFDNTAVTEDIILHAKWENCVHVYENNICVICGYKKVTYHSSRQKPTVITPEHGKITLSYNGRTATITPDEGYEITSVKVNDIEKGAVSTVTGLRTGDRIEATFEKTEATLIAEIKEALASVSPVARTSKTTKGNIKVVLNLSDEEKVIIANFREQGYIVKYRFYRSTKKSSGYAARIEKDTDTFINTVGSKGTRYYYKVRIMVYDESGNIVAKTALSDCKYASRVWSK